MSRIQNIVLEFLLNKNFKTGIEIENSKQNYGSGK